MKLFKSKSPIIGQAGFTVIELIAALAITGLIGFGASIATAQVLTQTSRNSDYTLASRNALNALYWISLDASMAQSINGTDGFPQTEDLSLSWKGWDNIEYSANYTLENGVLKRIFTDNGAVTTTVIASNIDPGVSLTYCQFEDGILTVTITSSVGEGDKVVSVTKVREISPRPGL